jgi:flagellar hook-associated protein 2
VSSVSSTGSSSPTTSSSTNSSSSTTGSSSTSSSGSTTGSTGSSSVPFQISGLASGLDTASIIDKMAQVYSLPMTQLQQDESTIAQKQTAWNDIQSKMEALQTAVQALQDPKAISARTGTATPPSGTGQVAAVSVSATSSALLGTYKVNVKQLATNATLTSGSSISSPITVANASAKSLSSLGLAIAPTNGTFTVNGRQMTVDSATTLLGGAGSDSIEAQLAAAGVTLSTTTSGGNITGITLTSTSGTPIQIGNTSDTSNILTALRLTTSPDIGNSTVNSSGSLSGTTLSTPITSMALATPLATTSGSFTVNGATVNYTTQDTLGSIIAAINSSSAGVTATYDSLSDKMVLTANQTGTGAISVVDVGSGNMAAALNLTSTTGQSSGGQAAIFTISGINSGNPIASQSNTVANVIPGVTLNLQSVSPDMTAANATTVTIAQDNSAIVNALQSFVKAYNDVQDTASKYTAVTMDSSGNISNAGILTGDSSLSQLGASLDRIVNGTSVRIGGQSYSLASLGISTGAVGSFSPGQSLTLDLTFDTTQANNALAATPSLAQSFAGSGTITSQKGTLFQTLYDAIDQWTSPLGIIGTSLDSLTTMYANDEVQIRNWQDRITAYRSQLSDMFTNMETSVAQLTAQGQALTSALGSATSNNSNSSSSSSSK